MDYMQMIYVCFLILTTLFAICIINAVIAILNRKSLNLPPGPIGLPLIGYVHRLKPRSFVAFQKLAENYGAVFCIPVMGRQVVILNSIGTIKEAFVENGNTFTGRLRINIFENYFHLGKGLIFTDGALWKEHRRFSLKVLHDLGFGRPIIENIVIAEIKELYKILDKSINKPVAESTIIRCSITNVICQILFANRVDDDPLIQKLMDIFMKIINSSLSTNIAFQMVMQMANNPIFDWFVVQALRKANSFQMNDEMVMTINQMITNCESQINSQDVQEPTSYLEAIILEKLKKQNSDLPHTFDNFQICRNVMELFLAGMDTTSVSITWALVLLSLHVKIQDKVYMELASQLSKDDFVSLNLRKKCPYTSAVIEEVLRFSSIVPKGLLRRAIEPCKLMKYNIPKDTLCYANIYAAHRDPKIWLHPNKFYPEHFLSENQKEFVPSDNIVAFSIGKRACIGESLARTELWLFLSALLHRYKVDLHNKETLNLDKFLLGHDGDIRDLDDHQIVFIRR